MIQELLGFFSPKLWKNSTFIAGEQMQSLFLIYNAPQQS
jgi:hypothetical protein